MLRLLLASLHLVILPFWAPVLGAQEVSARAGELQVGGRLQVQYTRSSVQDAVDDIRIRRAWLELGAEVSPAWSGALLFDVAGGNAQIVDAFVRLELGVAALMAGRKKIPFDPFFLASSADLPVVERDGRIGGLDSCPGVGRICSYGQLTQGLGFAGRDQGVWVEGGTGAVAWAASLTNGTGSGTRDDNDSKTLTARSTVEVTPGLVVGGSLALRDAPGADGDGERATGWEVDLEVGDWAAGPHLVVALAGGENWRAPRDDGVVPDFLAAQGLLTLHRPVDLGPVTGVEPLLRLSLADPRRGISEDVGVLVTPGITAYLSRRNMVGVNLDVHDGPDGTEYSWKIQSFLFF